MKTILVTTSYVDQHENLCKTIKFCNYYNTLKHKLWVPGTPEIPLMVLENGSSKQSVELLQVNTHLDMLHVFDKVYLRPTHLDYKYIWRMVYYFQELFKQGYEKIVYLDNDLFLVSDKAMNHVKNFKSGWLTVFSEMYNFPESAFLVVTKDCKEYWNFVKGLTEDEFIAKYNGKTAERNLPFTEINKELIGDRYSEMTIPRKQDNTMDYIGQTHVTEIPVFGMKK